MKVLFPAWTAAKADEEKLKALHDLAVELLMQGVHADMSAAQMQLLTAKLPLKGSGGAEKVAAAARLCGGVEQPGRAGRGFAKGAAGQSRTPRPRRATSCLRAMILKRFSGLDLRARMRPFRSATTSS